MRVGFVTIALKRKKTSSQGFSLCRPGLSLLPFHQHQSMSQQQQHQQQQGTNSSIRPDPEAETLSPNSQQRQPHRHGNVTFKDQVREDRLPSPSLGAAVGASGRAAVAATIADDIPIVSAAPVRESQIAAEEQVVRLQEKAARRAAEAEAEAARRAAEAERLDHEVRLAQVERQLANQGNIHNSGGNSTPKQPLSQRCCIVVVVVVVLIAAAAAVVAGICGTGRCSSRTTYPARAYTILSYINGITLSGQTLTYPGRSSAEERAVRWLIDDHLGTAVDDEQSLRQRYVLGTLWFLHDEAGFGSADHGSTDHSSADHAASWTTTLSECQWLNVECDADGHVTLCCFCGP
jgi:hypothetical protein